MINVEKTMTRHTKLIMFKGMRENKKPKKLFVTYKIDLTDRISSKRKINCIDIENEVEDNDQFYNDIEDFIKKEDEIFTIDRNISIDYGIKFEGCINHYKCRCI